MVNHLADDNIHVLTLFNLKAIVKDIFSRSEILFYEVENIVGNRENADNQHFLLFPKYFLMSVSSERQKS